MAWSEMMRGRKKQKNRYPLLHSLLFLFLLKRPEPVFVSVYNLLHICVAKCLVRAVYMEISYPYVKVKKIRGKLPSKC